MSNAAITSALTRSVANSLVERAERQTGSRMAAYEMVAATVGTSSDWLRKFIRGGEAKEPGWTIGWNILDQYSRICNRVEQEMKRSGLRSWLSRNKSMRLIRLLVEWWKARRTRKRLERERNRGKRGQGE